MSSRWRIESRSDIWGNQQVTITDEPSATDVAGALLALLIFAGVIFAAIGGVAVLLLVVIAIVGLAAQHPKASFAIAIIALLAFGVYLLVTQTPVVAFVQGFIASINLTSIAIVIGGLIGIGSYLNEDDDAGLLTMILAGTCGAAAMYVGGIFGAKLGEFIRYLLENEMSLVPFQIFGYILAAMWIANTMWALYYLMGSTITTAVICSVMTALIAILFANTGWFPVSTSGLEFAVLAAIAIATYQLLISTPIGLWRLLTQQPKGPVSLFFGLLIMLIVLIFFALLEGLLTGSVVGITGPTLFDLVTSYNNKVTRSLMEYPLIVSAALGGAFAGLFYGSLKAMNARAQR